MAKIGAEIEEKQGIIRSKETKFDQKRLNNQKKEKDKKRDLSDSVFASDSELKWRFSCRTPPAKSM